MVLDDDWRHEIQRRGHRKDEVPEADFQPVPAILVHSLSPSRPGLVL
jgi:hypothetical protein